MKLLRHLRMLVFLGLRYVYADLEGMRVSGYDVENMPDLADRREQRALGEWLLKWLPKPLGSEGEERDL